MRALWLPHICLLLTGASLFASDSPYEPLWLYQGSWDAARPAAGAAAASDTLVNDCALAGQFFTCQQTVNGKVTALLVFIPADTPGRYYTQALLPNGRATG